MLSLVTHGGMIYSQFILFYENLAWRIVFFISWLVYLSLINVTAVSVVKTYITHMTCFTTKWALEKRFYQVHLPTADDPPIAIAPSNCCKEMKKIQIYN